MLNKKSLIKYLPNLIFVVSLVATLGSLFFSEVLKLPPCVLCWYQRICMYPIATIMAVGLFRNDKNAIYYAIPLSLIGATIAIYHNLLYYKIIPESLAPCVNGVSCTTKFFEWFGFITIPFLSLMAFVVILASSLLYIKFSKKN